MSWETVIGLETHVQLSTKTKLFSRASLVATISVAAFSDVGCYLNSSVLVIISSTVLKGWAGGRAGGRAGARLWPDRVASEPQAVPSPVAMAEPSRTPSEAGGAQDVGKQMNPSVLFWDDPETANAEDESRGSNEAVDMSRMRRWRRRLRRWRRRM